ncbi:tRNA (adenosine(37)-N6)-dimethylallyltransferase MiaA [Paracoccus sp. 1_MG-2023]|uniref:tRNA (adenosine(37)-N6)-dimethylallyltransferase MiaA n=1 Tax=unclassified Paracoccus (in: a-proteobacteria) TaxID=2688777 RepID=UPI001C08674D|nr:MULTISPECIES: tRNA (adenosine(37)-N6)-dimethylallyltransferase MiaA [unclassified Paracoccus (in: a-proteobacteria)]MBU2958553.1 tRNA (adenosine(37)-N6)-dimethylallyltransferase MiaA [Paracoccus sp. C2R09]MDO6667546.1 tRNA (adenosine(37)-N6)-dimethylallyltransferase MiaA [Paracoccus sp. 1_MG-2023]
MRIPDLTYIDASRHLLIAGPTASGKSALALAVARAQGGLVVNADALQVWSNWRVLTARPSPDDEAAAPHALYGHVAPGRAYSVGDWLREVSGLLDRRLIVVGGTGLYLTALTRGLAEIPATPPHVRQLADARIAAGDLPAMIEELDAATRAAIDLRNPVRVQRAWEVLTATGRGIRDWQDATPPPLIAPQDCQRIQIVSDRDWLADRIARRFHLMLDQGALDEVRANLPIWDPAQQWAKAIGAPELVRHLQGDTTLPEAVQQAIIASRQYAKGQRAWFRGRMRDWDMWQAGNEGLHPV